MSHSDHKVIYKQREERERERTKGRKRKIARSNYVLCYCVHSLNRVYTLTVSKIAFLFSSLWTLSSFVSSFSFLFRWCVCVHSLLHYNSLACSFFLVTLIFFSLRFTLFVSVFINAFIIIAHINCRSK